MARTAAVRPTWPPPSPTTSFRLVHRRCSSLSPICSIICRATFSPESGTTLDRRFDEIKSAPLLVLDDLGTQNMTPWVQEKLYQLFNYRYTAQLPTVITTSDDPEEMDPRIMSRLQDTRLCQNILSECSTVHREKSLI